MSDTVNFDSKGARDVDFDTSRSCAVFVVSTIASLAHLPLILGDLLLLSIGIDKVRAVGQEDLTGSLADEANLVLVVADDDRGALLRAVEGELHVAATAEVHVPHRLVVSRPLGGAQHQNQRALRGRSNDLRPRVVVSVDNHVALLVLVLQKGSGVDGSVQADVALGDVIRRVPAMKKES